MAIGRFKKSVIYFDNYFTKVSTVFYIVHCFVLNGLFQGYLVISTIRKT